jgi:hypothetical protein
MNLTCVIARLMKSAEAILKGERSNPSIQSEIATPYGLAMTGSEELAMTGSEGLARIITRIC